jgi:MoxR-like ATPase
MTMTTPDLPSLDVADVRTRFLSNGRLMGSFMYERDDEIHTATIALLTAEHVIWVGPPGTGKSALARIVASQIEGGIYREYLLSRQSTEADVIASKSIPDMMNGQEVWITKDHLTEAHVAFADEVFKASGSTLNSCLGWLNERIVKGSIKSPLVTCFGASNEWIEDDSLKALRDRFLIGHVVDYMQTKATRIAFAKDRAAGRKPPALAGITLDELYAAQAAVAAVGIEEPVFEAVADVQTNLESVGVKVSDRTIGKAYGVLKAAAWLDGSPVVGLEHTDVLKHVLWRDPAEITAVTAALGGINKGVIGEIRAIVEASLRDFYTLRAACDANGSWASVTARDAYVAKCPELMQACLAASDEIKRKFGGTVPPRVKVRAIDYMNELRGAFNTAKADSAVNI